MKPHGIDVILHERVSSGFDELGEPVFTDTTKTISNVLVVPASSEDIINELSLSGKHIVYQLGIPKGNTDNWTEAIVEFYGEKFRTIGIPEQGIEDLIPLDWNKKIKVERYE